MNRGGDRVIDVGNRHGARGSDADAIERHPTAIQGVADNVIVIVIVAVVRVLGRLRAPGNRRRDDRAAGRRIHPHVTAHVEHNAPDLRCLHRRPLADPGRHIAVEQGNRRRDAHEFLGAGYLRIGHRDQIAMVGGGHAHLSGRARPAGDLDTGCWRGDRGLENLLPRLPVKHGGHSGKDPAGGFSAPVGQSDDRAPVGGVHRQAAVAEGDPRRPARRDIHLGGRGLHPLGIGQRSGAADHGPGRVAEGVDGDREAEAILDLFGLTAGPGELRQDARGPHGDRLLGAGRHRRVAIDLDAVLDDRLAAVVDKDRLHRAGDGIFDDRVAVLLVLGEQALEIFVFGDLGCQVILLVCTAFSAGLMKPVADSVGFERELDEF